MSNNLLLPSKFAKAILSCLASQPAAIQQLVEQNYKLIKLLKDQPQLDAYFHDLTILKKDKLAALNTLLNVAPIEPSLARGLTIFIDHGHSGLFLPLLKAIDYYGLLLLNTKKVQVFSAIKLNNQQKKQLEQAWNKKIAHQLVFHYEVDPELLLGIKVRVDDYVEEYSLKSQLAQLKKLINQG